MTFLELVQKAANESGIVPNAGPPGSASARPASVLTATGTEGKIVGWVQDAWRDLQVAKSRWRWMRADFDKAMVANQATQTATDLALTRVSKWVPFGDEGEALFSLYVSATGTSDQTPLTFMPWSRFYATHVRTPLSAGRPYCYTIDDAGTLRFAPKPDVAYKLCGMYRKTVQVLALDADLPELPTDHHDMIWIGAVEKMDLYDEAAARMVVWMRRRDQMLAELIRDQLPAVTADAPLA